MGGNDGDYGRQPRRRPQRHARPGPAPLDPQAGEHQHPRQKGEIDRDIGHQGQDEPAPGRAPKDQPGEQQQLAQAIAAGDNAIFEQREITGQDQQLEPGRERRAQPDQGRDRQGDHHLRRLQRGGRSDHRLEDAEGQIPEPRMAFVVQVGEEAGHADGVADQQIGLQLVAPGRMGGDQPKLQADQQAERKLRPEPATDDSHAPRLAG